MNPLFVGIDASSKSNVVCLMKPDGTKFGTFSVQNNLGGTKILSEKNRVGAGRTSTQRSEDRIGKNIGVALALIGLETSSMFQAAFVRALPHNESRTFVERFCRKTKFRKRRNTVCISSFLNCRIEAKDPAKVEDELCGIALDTIDNVAGWNGSSYTKNVYMKQVFSTKLAVCDDRIFFVLLWISRISGIPQARASAICICRIRIPLMKGLKQALL